MSTFVTMKKTLLTICILLAPVLMRAQESTPSSATFCHPWQNAVVAYLGDSITDPGERPDGHDWTGRENWHYWGCLQQWLGIRPLVYGVSGNKWSDIPRQVSELQAEHGDDFDAITIFMGANDYITDTPIGEWYDYARDTVVMALGYPATEYDVVKRIPSMDPGTLKGRINISMAILKATYPEKQIVVLTPLHRAYSTFSEQNIQPAESYPNRLGLYFSDYVDAIKETANVWGVPVIDLNSLSGLNPMSEAQVPYFCNPDTDRLHPNAKGHDRIAKTLFYQLLTLPCRF